MPTPSLLDWLREMGVASIPLIPIALGAVLLLTFLVRAVVLNLRPKVDKSDRFQSKGSMDRGEDGTSP